MPVIISGFDNLDIDVNETLLMANNSSSQKILNINENRFMSAWVKLETLNQEKIGYILGVSSLKEFDNSIQSTIYSIVKKMSAPYLIMVLIMVFLGKNIAVTVKNLQNLRKNLQKEVDLKTKEVVEKSYNIKTMLENLRQGVFTILGNGKLDKDYSDHLESILGTSEIEGKEFNEIFLSKTDLPGDQKNLIENAIIMTIGECDLSYQANKHVFPRECIYITSDNKKTDIEVDWSPIISEETKTIEKIMVTIRDVSEFKELQERAKKQEFELKAVAEILKSQPETARSAIKSAKNVAQYCIDQFDYPNRSINQNEMLRKIHTVKGLSRVVNFTFLSEEIHNIESNLIDYFKENTTISWVKMKAQFKNFHHVSEVYEQVLKTKIINFIDNANKKDSVEKNYLLDLSKRLKNYLKQTPSKLSIKNIILDIRVV